MNNLKILIVEDEETQIERYKDTFEEYEDDNPDFNFEIDEAKTLDEALDKLDKKYDFAIIDLKLSKQKSSEGNTVVHKINKNFRIPIFIVSGTLNHFDESLNCVNKYNRTDSMEDMVNELVEVFKTGLTKILGGKGSLENIMNRIFTDNILPYIDIWKNYVKEGFSTEDALMRHTINCMMEILDDSDESFFSEEMYIFPPVSKDYQTGSIIMSKSNETNYMIISPACDMVYRGGSPKTESIQIVEIDSRHNSNVRRFINVVKSTDKNQDEKDSAKRIITNIVRNNHMGNYHYLPPINCFDGGYINFRKIKSIKLRELKRDYNEPTLKISGSFLKDIISRFSTYYARQGQPDFDSKILVDELINSCRD